MVEYRKEMVAVDKDALDFLKVIYFGAITDPFEAASFRAYRDFNRTLRFGDTGTETRKELRKQATSILRERIADIAEETHMTQEDFDAWHRETCRLVRQPYEAAGITFTWGQAQKWLNMTIKYLYIVGSYSFDCVFRFCHIPVDNYVFQIARKELGIPVPSERWSRWNDYDGQYMTYQKELRSRIKGYDPLRWEFKFWMKEARQLADEGLDI